MEYQVLGSLEARDGDRPVRVGSAEQRRLLAALLLHANAVVSVDRLAEIVWGDAPPADVATALQTEVDQLRTTLEPGRSPDGTVGSLMTRTPGYLLAVETDQLDTSRFERLVGAGQQHAADGDPAAAAALLDEALALWRGAPFAEFTDADFAKTEARRLEALRRVAIEERVEANLSLGIHADRAGRDRSPTVLAASPPVAAATATDARAPDGDVPSRGRPWRPRPGDAVASFVDRTDELDDLRHWLTESISGSPRVVVLTGDAGVGKSRLVTELIAEAREAGVRPFVGRCHEDTQLSLLALAPILDALGMDFRALADGAGTPTPDEHGARLVAVVDAGRALMAAAADRPALIVLEDAQWADPATVEFAAHVTATLAHEAVFRQLPLMMLVTARPGHGGDRAQRFLARLGHESVSRTMQLDGLDELGVFALLECQLSARPAEALLHLVLSATGGNPLEVAQLIARLARSNALELDDDQVVATVTEVSGLPLDADADVTTMLAGLSDDARQLLTTLAFVHDGRIETLRVATGLEPDTFEDVLDALLEQRVLADDGTRVEFVDGRARRAVVRGVTGRRRLRLHGQIGRRLADRGLRDSVATMEIADQMHRAGPDGDAAVLARAARIAGDEALALGMWNDATRYYEAALRTPSRTDAEDAELNRRAAIAAYHCHDARAAAEHADRAVSLARAAGDLRIWGDAALLRSRVIWNEDRPDPRPLREYLDIAGDALPEVRAQLHVRLSELAFNRMDLTEASADAAVAQRIAREIDDDLVLARIDFATGLERFGALDFDGAIDHFRRCGQRAHRVPDSLIESWALGRRPLVYWVQGNLDAAEAAAADAARHNREHGWWGEYSLVAAMRTGIAVAQGRLGAADRLAADAESAARRSEPTGAMGLLWSAVANARALLGDTIGAQRAIDEWQRDDPRVVAHFRVLVAALCDMGAPVDIDGDHTIESHVGAGTRADLRSLAQVGTNVELADASARPGLASGALEVLADAYARGARFSSGWCSFVPRLAGVACLLAGDHDAAEEWLRRAIVDAEASGAVGELARSRYDLARTLLAAERPTEARALLDDAIVELEHLGYRPLHVAARRLAGKPDLAPPGDDASWRVILITDLVDSTPLNQRLGDRRFVELLREHNRVVRSRLRQHDGVEFKHTGDGIGATFFTGGAAMQCALGIQADIEQFNIARDEPLQVRIGVSAGNVISNEGDLYGMAVIEAFRVCDHATDGRILVSPDVPPVVSSATGFGFRAVGETALKGFSNTRMLYQVVRI